MKTLEQQIIYAKSLLGKKDLLFKDGGKSYYIYDSVVIKYKGDSGSFGVEEYLRDHDFCVAVSGERGLAIYPAEWVAIPIQSKEVVLSGGFLAVVFEDHVDIATQRLSVGDLRKILAVHKEMWPDNS